MNQLLNVLGEANSGRFVSFFAKVWPRGAMNVSSIGIRISFFKKEHWIPILKNEMNKHIQLFQKTGSVKAHNTK